MPQEGLSALALLPIKTALKDKWITIVQLILLLLFGCLHGRFCVILHLTEESRWPCFRPASCFDIGLLFFLQFAIYCMLDVILIYRHMRSLLSKMCRTMCSVFEQTEIQHVDHEA